MNTIFEASLSDPVEVIRQGRLNGVCLAWIANPQASPLLQQIALDADAQRLEGTLQSERFGADLAGMLDRQLCGRKVGLFVYSGRTDRLSILIVLATLRNHLSDRAICLIDHADFTGVYDGLRESLMTVPSYRLNQIFIEYAATARPGHGIATLCFDRGLSVPQPNEDIPQSKNKQLEARFVSSAPLSSAERARSAVRDALARWMPETEEQARRAFRALQEEFPDEASPKVYWHEAYRQGFTEFFSWGHDQDFGFGMSRQGAMGTRHMEIVSEAIEYGYLPDDMKGMDVLDVGCWTGGDVLVLAGLDANVTAIEEHPVSSLAARRLCELLRVPAQIHTQSLYRDKPEWRGNFDVVYLSGVIYHVTDPLLALRTCFAYLKSGGRLVVETKASKLDGPYCEYGGTHEKGWNWYSPTLHVNMSLSLVCSCIESA